MPASKATIASLRFGYGFMPGAAAPSDAGDLMASLERGAAFAAPGLGGPPLDEQMVLFNSFVKMRKRHRKTRDPLATRAMKKGRREIRRRLDAAVSARVLTAALSPHGFFERLSWFWSDHFAIGARGQLAQIMAPRHVVDAIRPNLKGRFRDLLRAASLHPAMLLYLNQTASVGPNSKPGIRKGRGLNENLAREIIELHSLGVGAKYSQDDVRQFAELLTGVDVERSTGQQIFRANAAEPGAETVLGREYGGGEADLADVHAALDALADHPATARHIAAKLARHFVADTPSDDLINAMASTFRETDGDLSAVYAAMLDHPESWSRFGEKVRQPFDLLAASIRAIGPSERDLMAFSAVKDSDIGLLPRLNRLNQALFDPPGPHGWPEEAEAWITPNGLSERIAWASALGRHAADRIDPRDFVRTTLGDAASEEVGLAATRAAERWEGIALVLASPEFNRR